MGLMSEGQKYIVGVDEVGRGALAGPVVVCALMLSADFETGIEWRDSKKHTEKQREERFELIRQSSEIIYKLGRVAPSVIDKINIRQATDLAAQRAVDRLRKRLMGRAEVILDGGLSVWWEGREIKGRPKADENYLPVKMASIVAKVTRDRYMRKQDRVWPGYGFASHVGYGTAEHCRRIRKLGKCVLHRESFLGGELTK